MFAGEVIITLDVTEDTSTLTFNAHKGLFITHTVIETSDLKTSSRVFIPRGEQMQNEGQERIRLDLSKLPGGGLKAGTKGVRVWMRFSGDLIGNMVGYYKSEGATDEKTGKKQMCVLAPGQRCASIGANITAMR
jgi:aminopeptidase 2